MERIKVAFGLPYLMLLGETKISEADIYSTNNLFPRRSSIVR